METADEIIKRLSNKLNSLNEKGDTFKQIPLWHSFANHIAFENRFGGSEIKDTVCQYIDHVLLFKELTFKYSKDTIVYRARKIESNEITKNESGQKIGFNAKKSGMPPYRKTPNGRVNIAGIPILYTATEKKTACAELRSMKNDYISIAEYRIKEDVNVANFVLEHIDKVKGSMDGQAFLKDMFESFSFAISNEFIDYLPSEFISEYIRLNRSDLSGIRYSSLHNRGGYNLALFDDKKCEFLKSTVVRCTEVNYTFDEL